MRSIFMVMLFTLGLFATLHAQPTEYEKYMANKKSTTTTLALQLFFPGAGNAYAGQSIAKTVAYPVLSFGALTTGVLAAANSSYHDGAWIIGGISAYALINLIGTIDAVMGCEKHNAELRKKYQLVSNGKGLQLAINF
ncbi:MAG: hypothetical protein ACLFVE_14995 [Chitinispirillaceae bacterium]